MKLYVSFVPFWYPFSLVGIDDCDYNLHLSNSSYPKVSCRLFFPSSPLKFLCGEYRMGMSAEGDDPEYDGDTLMWVVQC